MRAGLLDAFIPCEAFEVTVQYGPEDVLSPLEIEVIHAINSGFNTLPVLVDLCRLGSRPMFDLVSGLWRADYIYVNLRDSTLRVKESVEKQIRERNFEELNRTEIREKSVMLMQELVTGAVLPILPHASMNNTYRIVPQFVPFGSYREIPLSRIADLVVSQSLRFGDEARSIKVLGVYLKPQMQAGGGASVSRRLMQLRLRYGIRYERPVVEIASPITIDGQIRRQLEEAIGQLAQERQDDPFSRYLLDRLSRGVDANGASSPKGLESLLADLERRVDVLRSLKAEEYQVRHQMLKNSAELALNGLHQRRARRARTRLLENPPETARAMEAALSSAKSQIVLCSPRATWAGAARYWSSIEQAVVGGATLFLLWGESRQSVLDKVLERNLVALSSRNECSDRVHWSQSGLGTNESFLVTDSKLAMLATFGLLDDPRAVPVSGLAVEFEARSGSWCEAIAALLERVRRNALHYMQAKALGQHWVAERTEDDSASFPAIPDEPARQVPGSPSSAEPNLYVEAWQAFARELRSAVAELGDCVEMIFDGGHRQVLMKALEDRPANLVIASRSVSLDAITMDFVTEVNACVNHGAQVSITYHSDRHSDGRTAERLDALGGQGGRLHLRKLATSGGVVATDAFAAISGFHFMGVPGFLMQESAQRRLDAGILVYGAGFARQVAKALGHRTITQDEPIAQVSGENVATEVLDSHDLRKLQSLTGDLQATAFTGDAALAQDAGLTMERVFRQASALALDKGQWNLFGAWVRRLDVGLATRSVATLLAQATLSDLQEVRAWRLWLVRDRWLQCQFVEAAVLLAGMRPEAAARSVPTFEMAKAAAANGIPGYRADRADLLVQAMDDGADVDRTVSWICIASMNLLVYGVPDAAGVLADLATRAPGSWAVWCRRLVHFWEEEGHAVPLEMFEARRQSRESLDQQEDARCHLGNSIEGLERVMQGLHFTLGKRTWDYLSSPDGWIGAIRNLVDQKDARGAAIWVAQLEAAKADHESILLDIEHRVYRADPTGVRNKRIEGSKRLRCLVGLQQVISAARNWVDKTSQVTSGGSTRHMEAKAQILGRELRGLIAAIQADPGNGELDVARPLYETMTQKLEILWTQS